MSDAADSTPDTTSGAAQALDLDAVERELADVDAALTRLDAGTYWTDEETGEAIADERLASDPLTRRAR